VGLANVGVWKNPGGPGFLGPSFSCFQPDGEGMANMKLNGITSDRLGDRQKLRLSLDQFKAEADATGMMRGVDAFTARAFDVLTSSKLLDALDLTKEDPRVVARYGDGKPYQFQYDGSPTINEHLLMARRLVEAGVRVVTLSYGRWDAHGDNFGMVRDHGGKLDQCLSALIEDLSLRGMLDDVTVIVWGEFGRTPTVELPQPGTDIKEISGRDHNHHGFSVWMAGGGVKGGTAYGATDELGFKAVEKPVHVHDLQATLLHCLGLDHTRLTFRHSGRDFRLTDIHGRVIEDWLA
jgi:hypothetical protein